MRRNETWTNVIKKNTHFEDCIGLPCIFFIARKALETSEETPGRNQVNGWTTKSLLACQTQGRVALRNCCHDHLALDFSNQYALLWQEICSTSNVISKKHKDTLLETNSLLLKIGQNPKGKACLPTIHFQVRAVSFREGNISKSLRHVVRKCEGFWGEHFFWKAMWIPKWADIHSGKAT